METITFCMDVPKLYLLLRACTALGIIPEDFPDPIPLPKRKQMGAVETKKPIPMEPSRKEIGRIRQDLLKEFADVFDSSTELKTIKGPPMKIELKEDAIPYAVHGARPIPYAWRDEVKRIINDNFAKGVWEPVGDRPTDWCHPLVVVPKPNGKLRICVDLKKLKDQVCRPVHPMKTPREAITGITPNAKYFGTLDAVHGYWQLDLEEDSRDLMCFISPYGLFIHCRAPMGYIASGNAYNLCCAGEMPGVQHHAEPREVPLCLGGGQVRWVPCLAQGNLG
jgi:hypothetical protein